METSGVKSRTKGDQTFGKVMINFILIIAKKNKEEKNLWVRDKAIFIKEYVCLTRKKSNEHYDKKQESTYTIMIDNRNYWRSKERVLIISLCIFFIFRNNWKEILLLPIGDNYCCSDYNYFQKSDGIWKSNRYNDWSYRLRN
jgi:hypothetical protein